MLVVCSGAIRCVCMLAVCLDCRAFALLLRVGFHRPPLLPVGGCSVGSQIGWWTLPLNSRNKNRICSFLAFCWACSLLRRARRNGPSACGFRWPPEPALWAGPQGPDPWGNRSRTPVVYCCLPCSPNQRTTEKTTSGRWVSLAPVASSGLPKMDWP